MCISSATPKQAAGEEAALRAKRSGGDAPTRRVVPDGSLPLWTAFVGACLVVLWDRGVVGQRDAVARYLFRRSLRSSLWQVASRLAVSESLNCLEPAVGLEPTTC